MSEVENKKDLPASREELDNLINDLADFINSPKEPDQEPETQVPAAGACAHHDHCQNKFVEEHEKLGRGPLQMVLNDGENAALCFISDSGEAISEAADDQAKVEALLKLCAVMVGFGVHLGLDGDLKGKEDDNDEKR